MAALALLSGCAHTPPAGQAALATAQIRPGASGAPSAVVVARPPAAIEPAPPAPAALPNQPPAPPTEPSEPSAIEPLPAPSIDALTQRTIEPTSPPSEPTAAATPSADSDAAREAQLLALVNQLRAEHALAAYAGEPELGEVARAHSCDLAAHGLISHTSSDGRTLQERLGERLARWAWPSESIAAGTDDPAQVIALWMDEPPDGWHRRNLLDSEQQAAGIGFCAAPDDPSGNRFYWTMVVARRA